MRDTGRSRILLWEENLPADWWEAIFAVDGERQPDSLCHRGPRLRQEWKCLFLAEGACSLTACQIDFLIAKEKMDLLPASEGRIPAPSATLVSSAILCLVSLGRLTGAYLRSSLQEGASNQCV